MEAIQADVRTEKLQKDIESMQAKKKEFEAILRKTMDENQTMQRKLVGAFVLILKQVTLIGWILSTLF